MPLHDTEKYTIRDLFEENVQFSIPSYQRAYSWEVDGARKHVRQFIEDLVEQHPQKDYYLGHFLFEEDQPGRLFVIDGQQRLTTVIIFFSCLIRELGARVAHDATGQSVEELDLGRLAQTYLRRNGKRRFTTVQSDAPFFNDLILDRTSTGSGDTRSRKRIAEADAYFTKEFKRAETPTLVHWANLVERAAITTFKVSDKVQATQIFSFQNDRGKGLTDLEKLKAFLAYQVYLNSEEDLEPEAIEHVERRFAEIYEKTEEIEWLNEDQILAHHCTAYLQFWGTGVEAVKKEIGAIQGRIGKVDRVKSFSSALRDSFSHVKALEALATKHECIADPIILDGPNAWPMLIKLYKHFGDGLLSDRFSRLLQLIEISIFKFKFLHGSCKNLLPDWAKAFNGQGLEDLEAKLTFAAKHSFMGGQDCDKSFRNSLESSYHWTPTFRYVLWKYENANRVTGDYELSPGIYMNELGDPRMGSTLDHITPRNPKDVSYEESFNRDYLNNLGNLVLMPHGMNARFKNKLPAEKQALLTESSLASHREVGKTIQKEGKWEQEQIESRKKKLVTFALERWEAQAIAFKGEITL
jgi:hypothetical protein